MRKENCMLCYCSLINDYANVKKLGLRLNSKNLTFLNFVKLTDGRCFSQLSSENALDMQ